MLCSVKSTAMPRSITSCLVNAISALRSLGAMPAVGSSISSSLGLLAMAMASSTRLTSP
ncbi:hypothetical protein D3C84_1202010 [compost metagenome]